MALDIPCPISSRIISRTFVGFGKSPTHNYLYIYFHLLNWIYVAFLFFMLREKNELN